MLQSASNPSVKLIFFLSDNIVILKGQARPLSAQ